MCFYFIACVFKKSSVTQLIDAETGLRFATGVVEIP
jgi:hypothetical protein